MKKLTKIASLLSLISALGLSSCSIAPHHDVVPHGDMTMAGIYHHQQAQAFQASSAAFAPIRPTNVARGAKAIRSQFQVVPNPSIPLYIYPHLATQGAQAVPVPGYTTAFFLYERNHYALSGERGLR